MPPLHLVTIFEAAARLQSFKLASEELFITPSAVSHQIKALEEFVGFELFVRKTRGVELNQAGKFYLHFVQQSLDTLILGTKKLTSKFSSPSLKISTFPSMASNVIIPQLSLFQDAHPDIDIVIETGMNITNLRYEDCDLALRIGQGNWPDVVCDKILDISVAAVCSPEFAQKHQLRHPEQISQVPLIDLNKFDNMWQQWATACGLNIDNYEKKLSFSNYDSSLHAAQQGLGLAIALMPIEQSLFDRNVLVNPFNLTFPYNLSLYAAYQPHDKDRHDIHCFIGWLRKSPIIANTIAHQKL